MNTFLALLFFVEAVQCEEALNQVGGAVYIARSNRTIDSRNLLEATACTDRNWQCHGWAQLGYCATNAGYMRRMCRKSCNLCGGGGGPSCRGLNEPCWVNAQCCSARCHPSTYHCRPVGGGAR
mmetsp:Transcript_80272/g.98312  ORF Transcript_80272/g.98312 Transcript_80272/m.98312 type:complete len:123 (-) Transcript_80272:170-538(-)